MVKIDARMKRPEDFGKIIVARKGAAGGTATAVTVDQVARIADGAQELDSLALYNGQRTLLLSVQKAQDENTIAGGRRPEQGRGRDCSRCCRPARGWNSSATARARYAWRSRTCAAR